MPGRLANQNNDLIASRIHIYHIYLVRASQILSLKIGYQNCSKLVYKFIGGTLVCHKTSLARVLISRNAVRVYSSHNHNEQSFYHLTT